MSDKPQADDLETAIDEVAATVAASAQVNDTPTEESVEVQSADETSNEAESDIAKELAEAQDKIKDYWDQIVRLNAEMDNHRKRAVRDVENAHKYAVKNFSEALLPVCDSMEMGIAASIADNANIDSIKEGMEMTMTMFAQMLEKNGITAIDPMGDKFDPDKHQAMSMQESPDHEPNRVMAVMQKGYLIKDRLIRPAMVMVSK